ESRLNMQYPGYTIPERELINTELLLMPAQTDSSDVALEKGPNIKSLPDFQSLKEHVNDSNGFPVLLKMQDNISTDEILRAGAQVLPLRSNIEAISKWSFYIIDQNFYTRARSAYEEYGGHIVVAGDNYAQGSSREHAAIAPRYLGQVAVIARSYARIGWQNLINFGIVPLEFQDPEDYNRIEQGDLITLPGLADSIRANQTTQVYNQSKDETYTATYSMSSRQRDVILAGGVINHFKNAA
ncbi:MAG: hypothetical protein KDK34_23565, partial [Leptospiraceae bacterium]|nr:hypothetical protein [Leptospiraceae bacterium]